MVTKVQASVTITMCIKMVFHLRITLFMIMIYLTSMVVGVENLLTALIVECKSLQGNFIVGLMR